jgi:hypothetical protein
MILLFDFFLFLKCRGNIKKPMTLETILPIPTAGAMKKLSIYNPFESRMLDCNAYT